MEQLARLRFDEVRVRLQGYKATGDVTEVNGLNGNDFLLGVDLLLVRIKLLVLRPYIRMCLLVLINTVIGTMYGQVAFCI